MRRVGIDHRPHRGHSDHVGCPFLPHAVEPLLHRAQRKAARPDHRAAIGQRQHRSLDHPVGVGQDHVVEDAGCRLVAEHPAHRGKVGQQVAPRDHYPGWRTGGAGGEQQVGQAIAVSRQARIAAGLAGGEARHRVGLAEQGAKPARGCAFRLEHELRQAGGQCGFWLEAFAYQPFRLGQVGNGGKAGIGRLRRDHDRHHAIQQGGDPGGNRRRLVGAADHQPVTFGQCHRIELRQPAPHQRQQVGIGQGAPRHDEEIGPSLRLQGVPQVSQRQDSWRHALFPVLDRKR